VRDERTVWKRRELDDIYALRAFRNHCAGKLQSQTGLADTTGAGQRKKSSATQQSASFRQFVLSADERANGQRETGFCR
jgi:hypothetical protein